MKKTIAVLALCALFATMSIATAVPQHQERYRQETVTTPQVEWTGEFDGQFGIGRGDNHTVLGYIDGFYKIRTQNRMRGYFAGNWTTINGTKSGQFRGIFSERGIIGRISGDGYNRTLRFMGFFRYNETKFVGRIMSWVGPAVYIYGDHWEL
ncbi:MAG: hypothetical protein KKC68_04080 [Candidatus Thermoplasmatota archaeon]|nr:hypothetical protein [Candidatus Thermoplasmatota archaeon]